MNNLSTTKRLGSHHSTHTMNDDDSTPLSWAATLDSWKTTAVGMGHDNLPEDVKESPHSYFPKKFWEYRKTLSPENHTALTQFIWEQMFALQQELVAEYNALPEVGAMDYEAKCKAYTDKHSSLSRFVCILANLRERSEWNQLIYEEECDPTAYFAAQCKDVDHVKQMFLKNIHFDVRDAALIPNAQCNSAVQINVHSLFLGNAEPALKAKYIAETINLWDNNTTDIISIAKDDLLPIDTATIQTFLDAPQDDKTSTAQLLNRIHQMAIQLSCLERLYSLLSPQHILAESAEHYYRYVLALLTLFVHHMKSYVARQMAKKSDGQDAFVAFVDPLDWFDSRIRCEERPLFDHSRVFDKFLRFIAQPIITSPIAAKDEQVVATCDAAFKKYGVELFEKQLEMVNMCLTLSTHPFVYSQLKQRTEEFAALQKRFGDEYLMQELLAKAANDKAMDLYPQAVLLVSNVHNNVDLVRAPRPPSKPFDDIKPMLEEALRDATEENVELPSALSSVIHTLEPHVMQDIFFFLFTELNKAPLDDTMKYEQITGLASEIACSTDGEYGFFIPERQEKSAALWELMMVCLIKYEAPREAENIYKPFPWSLCEFMGCDGLQQAIDDLKLFTDKKDIFTISAPHLFTTDVTTVATLGKNDLSTLMSQLSEVELMYRDFTPLHVLEQSAVDYLTLTMAVQQRQYQLMLAHVAEVGGGDKVVIIPPRDDKDDPIDTTDDTTKEPFCKSEGGFYRTHGLSTQVFSTITNRPPYGMADDDARYLNMKKIWSDAFVAAQSQFDGVKIIVELANLIYSSTFPFSERQVGCLTSPFYQLATALGKEKFITMVPPLVEALGSKKEVVDLVQNVIKKI